MVECREIVLIVCWMLWMHVGISTESVSQDWWKNAYTGLQTWHGLSSDTYRPFLYGPWLDQEKSRKGTNV